MSAFENNDYSEMMTQSANDEKPPTSECQNLFQCPICLSALILPITLTCGHSFCEPCIKAKHFKYVKNVCPICRQKIATKINNFSVNVILDQVLVARYGSEKSYADRLQTTKKIKYPKGLRYLDDIIKWVKDKAPWLLILVLIYHLFKVKVNVYNFSLQAYKDKALEIANTIKGEDSLDFKFLLFSQFMRILFSNIVIP